LLTLKQVGGKGLFFFLKKNKKPGTCSDLKQKGFCTKIFQLSLKAPLAG
jgi:hypothetical protein